MKKQYIKPYMETELFIPNEYMSNCQIELTCNIEKGWGFYNTNSYTGLQAWGYTTDAGEVISEDDCYADLVGGCGDVFTLSPDEYTTEEGWWVPNGRVYEEYPNFNSFSKDMRNTIFDSFKYDVTVYYINGDSHPHLGTVKSINHS